jgi:hypothetical protein
MATNDISVNTVVLSEFRHDAGRLRNETPAGNDDPSKKDLQEIVRLVSMQIAAPQYHLDAVVEKTVEIASPQIEMRVRNDLQELFDAVERFCTGNGSSALSSMASGTFIRIFLKIASRAIAEKKIRCLIRELIDIRPTGRCIAADGDLNEVRQILSHADSYGDDLCLDQLKSYAEQLIANYYRERPPPAPDRYEERCDRNGIW